MEREGEFERGEEEEIRISFPDLKKRETKTQRMLGEGNPSHSLSMKEEKRTPTEHTKFSRLSLAFFALPHTHASLSRPGYKTPLFLSLLGEKKRHRNTYTKPFLPSLQLRSVFGEGSSHTGMQKREREGEERRGREKRMKKHFFAASPIFLSPPFPLLLFYMRPLARA